MKLYMFLTVRLSIIRSLFTVHSAMVYLVGFIIQKFVTMQGHMNVKKLSFTSLVL